MTIENRQNTQQAFLEGMSRAACTVNVVTTDGPRGRAGLTVSAMSSVSAEPPILLVCLHHKSAAAEKILENGVFGVNLLRREQANLSDVFAGRVKRDKFACARWRIGATGVPLLTDALAAFDCRLIHRQRVGTHHVLFGAVEQAVAAKFGDPLVYANRAYGGWSRLEELAA